MKYLALVFVAYFFNLNSAFANEKIIENAQGTPYCNLVNRANLVKVFYHNDGADVVCEVEVTLKKLKWKSQSYRANKQEFLNNPLVSCLPSKDANHLLTQSFLAFGKGL